MLEPIVDANNITTASCLGIAVENKDEIAVKSLLESHANPNIKHNNQPVLQIATTNKHSKILKLLLKYGADVNAISELHQSALRIAVENDDLMTVSDLLEAGADTEILYRIELEVYSVIKRKYWNLKVLDIALLKNNAEIVELLLQKNALIGTSFFIAVTNCNSRIVEKFLLRGASINSRDKDGKTPLFHAVEGNNIEIVKLLLMIGASPNVRATNGLLLFHYAMKLGWQLNEEIFELLVHYGADINIPTEKGLLPINMLFKEQQIYYRLNSSAQKWIESLLKLFLANDADANTREKFGPGNILHAATKIGASRLVEILLLNRANINFIDKRGNTPFKYAVQSASESWKLFPNNNYLHANLLRGNNLDNSRHDSYYISRYLFHCKDKILPTRRVAQLMTQEIARLQAAKEQIHPQNLRKVKSPFVKSYYERCKKEIEVMKHRNLRPGLTYFDIITAKDSKLVFYARIEEVGKVLFSRNRVRELFPEYGDVLLGRIQKSRERVVLLALSVHTLKKALQFKFPYFISNKILNYLPSRDLRNLCTACNPTFFINSTYSQT